MFVLDSTFCATHSLTLDSPRMVHAFVVALSFKSVTPRDFQAVFECALIGSSDSPGIVETSIITLGSELLTLGIIQAASKRTLSLVFDAPVVFQTPVKAFIGHLTILSISANVGIST